MLAMSKTFVAVFHHHQRNPHRGTPRRAPMTGFLALTFGTLLSSQGTDAHQSGSLDPSWGNRSTLCLQRPRCQSGSAAAITLPGHATARVTVLRESPLLGRVTRPDRRGAHTRVRTREALVKSLPALENSASGGGVDTGQVAPTAAQDEPSPVQQRIRFRDCLRVLDPLVVHVRPALLYRPPRRRPARGQTAQRQQVD